MQAEQVLSPCPSICLEKSHRPSDAPSLFFLHLSTLSNENIEDWAVLFGSGSLDLLDYLKTFSHFTKYDVFIIEPLSGLSSDEELGSVGVGSGVLEVKKGQLRSWKEICRMGRTWWNRMEQTIVDEI